MCLTLFFFFFSGSFSLVLELLEIPLSTLFQSFGLVVLPNTQKKKQIPNHQQNNKLVEIGQCSFILMELAGLQCPRLPTPLVLNTQL